MAPGPDRLPPIPPEQLDDRQRAAAADITAGPRGELSGPFVPLLRSPELMSRLQRTGAFLRFDSSIEPRLLELCILLVARRWSQHFEWAYHCPLAITAGVPLDVIEAVAAGRRPDGLDPAAAAVWEVVDQLHRITDVDDATYATAVAVLGEVTLVELVATVGYYTTLAMVMNTSHTPAPEHDGPRLPDL